MHNFKNKIYDAFHIYNIHSEYKENNLTITRAFMHYVKLKNNFDLILAEEVKNIIISYKEFLINNNLPKIVLKPSLVIMKKKT